MKLALTFAFLLLLLTPAWAGPPLPDTTAIEAYLNGISTLRAHFVQESGDSQNVSGTFFLKRPGRLRFEYDPPMTDFIVSDGTFIHYYDGQMKQDSSAPVSQSLADFFLRRNIRLSGDISVNGIERKDGLLQVTLVETQDPQSGALTLMFSENPLQLQKWQTVDAQGVVTTVALSETQFGITLKNNLFYYYDPERKKSLLNN
jgi:outer membrane lipoprotein-sorting protein